MNFNQYAKLARVVFPEKNNRVVKFDYAPGYQVRFVMDIAARLFVYRVDAKDLEDETRKQFLCYEENFYVDFDEEK